MPASSVICWVALVAPPSKLPFLWAPESESLMLQRCAHSVAGVPNAPVAALLVNSARGAIPDPLLCLPPQPHPYPCPTMPTPNPNSMQATATLWH